MCQRMSGELWNQRHFAPPGQMAESWLLVGPLQSKIFFCTVWGRSLDLSWAGEETSEWMTEHTLLSSLFFIDREVEGGPAAPRQLHSIRLCSWRRGLSSGLSGPPVQGFLPDSFHLFHENTEGMLKGFNSKLLETEDPLSDRHTPQDTDKSLGLNSKLKPKLMFINHKSDRLLCVVKSSHGNWSQKGKVVWVQDTCLQREPQCPVHTCSGSIV